MNSLRRRERTFLNLEYWKQQTADKPLYPDLLWARPENRALAGKLLIIGGSGYNFKAAADAYGDALLAGIGTARVLLPDSLRKTVSSVFPETEFASSTPSGSFARTALAEALSLADWADGVLLAGDLGKNSETAIFLENFISKYDGLLTIAGDAADYCITESAACVDRERTVLALNFKQLQQLISALKHPTPVTSTMGLMPLVELMHDITAEHRAAVVTNYEDTIFVAYEGSVTTTFVSSDIIPSAELATWQIQNSNKILEGLTTSLVA